MIRHYRICLETITVEILPPFEFLSNTSIFAAHFSRKGKNNQSSPRNGIHGQRHKFRLRLVLQFAPTFGHRLVLCTRDEAENFATEATSARQDEYTDTLLQRARFTWTTIVCYHWNVRQSHLIHTRIFHRCCVLVDECSAFFRSYIQKAFTSLSFHMAAWELVGRSMYIIRRNERCTTMDPEEDQRFTRPLEKIRHSSESPHSFNSQPVLVKELEMWFTGRIEAVKGRS